MACIRRTRTGNCSHHQCKYWEIAERGSCVEILQVWDEYGKKKWICEVGEDCIHDCPYSFKKEEIFYFNEWEKK